MTAKIYLTAKDKHGERFSAELTPKKGAYIDLYKLKQEFEHMGMTEIEIKQNGAVVK